MHVKLAELLNDRPESEDFIRIANMHYEHRDFTIVAQVALEARRLATGWTVRVRFRVSEGWIYFFTPSSPNCS